jgi:hypothetical protein
MLCWEVPYGLRAVIAGADDLKQNLSNNRRFAGSIENDERIERYEKALARLGAAR